MSCYHGHWHHVGGCRGPRPWSPGDCRDWEWAGPDPGYGYGFRAAPGPRFGGRYARPSREDEATRLESYLAELRDELRAVEEELAELRTGDQQP